jgi:hypothetical protein
VQARNKYTTLSVFAPVYGVPSTGPYPEDMHRRMGLVNEPKSGAINPAPSGVFISCLHPKYPTRDIYLRWNMRKSSI